MMRTCTNCKQAKPETIEFFHTRDEGKRLHRQCRECVKAKVRASSKRRYDEQALANDSRRTEIAAEHPEDMVTCAVCGRVFPQITNTHLRTHGLSTGAYSAQYGAPLQSTGVKRRSAGNHGYAEGFRQKRSRAQSAYLLSPEGQHVRQQFLDGAKSAVLRHRESQGILTSRTSAIPPSLYGTILGVLLGDGTLKLPKHAGHAFLGMGQAEAQLPYLEWKTTLFGPLIPSGVVRVCARKTSKLTKTGAPVNTQPFYSTRTITHPYFTDLYPKLYKDGGKRNLSPELLEPLDPRGLAIWFMDDGCRKSSDGSVSLATNSFSDVALDTLITTLYSKWGLELTKHKARSGQTLYLRRSSQDRFYALITPFAVPCMYYKFSQEALVSYAPGSLLHVKEPDDEFRLRV